MGLLNKTLDLAIKATGTVVDTAGVNFFDIQIKYIINDKNI